MFRTKVTEKLKTRVFVQYFFSDNHAVCEIKWKNMVEPDRPPDENIMQRMRLVFWIAKATKKHTHTQTHLEYINPIAFTR